VARTLDPETREALVARVRFYRDLGLTEFYRRPVDSTSGAPEPALSLSKGLALFEPWDRPDGPGLFFVLMCWQRINRE